MTESGEYIFLVYLTLQNMGGINPGVVKSGANRQSGDTAGERLGGETTVLCTSQERYGCIEWSFTSPGKDDALTDVVSQLLGC